MFALRFFFKYGAQSRLVETQLESVFVRELFNFPFEFGVRFPYERVNEYELQP